MIVVIERAVCFLSRQGHGHALRICEVDVKPSVLIVIQKQYTARHRFVQILLLGRDGVLERDAACGRHIGKSNLRDFCRRRALGVSSDAKPGAEERDQQESKIKKKEKPEHKKGGHGDQCEFSMMAECG